MIGAEAFGDNSRVVGFVEIVVTESDGEGLHRLRTCASHQRHYGRRIDAATEQSSQGNVGNQTDLDRFSEAPLQFFQTLFFAGRLVGSVLRQVPILTNLDASIFKLEQVAGRKFLNWKKSGERIRNVAEIHVL